MDNFSIFLSILPSKGNHSEYTHTHTQFDIFYAHAHTYLFFQYEMSILICNFFHLIFVSLIAITVLHSIIKKFFSLMYSWHIISWTQSGLLPLLLYQNSCFQDHQYPLQLVSSQVLISLGFSVSYDMVNHSFLLEMLLSDGSHVNQYCSTSLPASFEDSSLSPWPLNFGVPRP